MSVFRTLEDNECHSYINWKRILAKSRAFEASERSIAVSMFVERKRRDNKVEKVVTKSSEQFEACSSGSAFCRGERS